MRNKNVNDQSLVYTFLATSEHFCSFYPHRQNLLCSTGPPRGGAEGAIYPRASGSKGPHNGPFSYSEKESQSNDTLLHLVEFSNVHNSDRSSNAIRSNLVYKNV